MIRFICARVAADVRTIEMIKPGEQAGGGGARDIVDKLLVVEAVVRSAVVCTWRNDGTKSRTAAGTHERKLLSLQSLNIVPGGLADVPLKARKVEALHVRRFAIWHRNDKQHHQQQCGKRTSLAQICPAHQFCKRGHALTL